MVVRISKIDSTKPPPTKRMLFVSMLDEKAILQCKRDNFRKAPWKQEATSRKEARTNIKMARYT
jgi:hypothetical protein